MKKAKLFISALFILLGATLYAQNVSVAGKISDAATGEGIPFAAVQVKGTSTGVAADVDGKFSIATSSNATLIISAIGYISEEFAVNGRTSINVTLEPDAELIDNAVVVGYGSAKPVSSLVGSVSTVKSDVVRNAPAASALDNLQGQVAGLSVLTTGGVAGDNAVSLQLHGMGSLGSSTAPLYI
ncbi:MAG: carboxypeptidase-like regulatory domain-containing protein, partial [Bacteroidales bacterium]|nr:carboxypeptidase-like regulatory domain-containing protein [Bacteroidales bacterium]